MNPPQSKRSNGLPIIRSIRASVLFFAALLIATTANANSSKPAPINYDKQYKAAEKLVYRKDYSAALKVLSSITDAKPDNADAWNLQGFSLRKTDRLEEAQAAYTNALKIDPEHKGALEYQGELYIKMGDMESARANLEKLKAVCPEGCDELELLQQALDTNQNSAG